MVLEEITKEVTDAESNAENQKNSLSDATRRHITPEQRSTRVQELSGETVISTTQRRRGTRTSLDLGHRRLPTDATPKEKRRRESFPSNGEKTDEEQPIRHKGGILEMLAEVHEQDYEFPDGFVIEVCASVTDVELHRIHDRYREEEQQLKELEVLMRENCDNLKAALLKFLDTVVGYALYVQTPRHLGVTSAMPLDSLIALWVVPEYQGHGHEKKMMHWWLRDCVRSVKHFTVVSATASLNALLQTEGFKRPKTTHGEDDQTYIAMI